MQREPPQTGSAPSRSPVHASSRSDIGRNDMASSMRTAVTASCQRLMEGISLELSKRSRTGVKGEDCRERHRRGTPSDVIKPRLDYTTGSYPLNRTNKRRLMSPPSSPDPPRMRPGRGPRGEWDLVSTRAGRPEARAEAEGSKQQPAPVSRKCRGTSRPWLSNPRVHLGATSRPLPRQNQLVAPTSVRHRSVVPAMVPRGYFFVG